MATGRVIGPGAGSPNGLPHSPQKLSLGLETTIGITTCRARSCAVMNRGAVGLSLARKTVTTADP